MPYYLVQHVTPLSDAQQDKLAEAITQIHSDLFTTPKLFVNVQFVDISQATLFVAGKRHRGNKVQAYVRPGQTRTRDHYMQLCRSINKAWDSNVAASELDAVFIHGTIVASFEQGFEVPEAGKDAEWIRDNYAAFVTKAEGGNEHFKDLVHEIGTRDAFKGIRKSP